MRERSSGVRAQSLSLSLCSQSLNPSDFVFFLSLLTLACGAVNTLYSLNVELNKWQTIKCSTSAQPSVENDLTCCYSCNYTPLRLFCWSEPVKWNRRGEIVVTNCLLLLMYSFLWLITNILNWLKYHSNDYTIDFFFLLSFFSTIIYLM